MEPRNKRRRLLERTITIKEVYGIASQSEEEEQEPMEEVYIIASQFEEKEQKIAMEEKGKEPWSESEDPFLVEEFSCEEGAEYVPEDSEYESSVDIDLGEMEEETDALDPSKILPRRTRKRKRDENLSILNLLNNMIERFGKKAPLRAKMQAAVDNEAFDVRFEFIQLQNSWEAICDRCFRTKTLSYVLWFDNDRYFVGCDCIKHVKILRDIFHELAFGLRPDPAHYWRVLNSVCKEINNKYPR